MEETIGINLNQVILAFITSGAAVALINLISKLLEPVITKLLKRDDLATKIAKENEKVFKGINDKIVELSGQVKEVKSTVSTNHETTESKFSEIRKDISDKVDQMMETYQGGLDRLKTTEDHLAKHVSEADKLQSDIIKSNKLIMREKIRRLALDAINRGYIYVDEHKLLFDMWKEYHDAWHGNGDLNDYMNRVKLLKIRSLGDQ